MKKVEENPESQDILGWSSFYELSGEPSFPVQVGYLPPIRAPPTERCLKGDMALWIESLIEMINMLINTTHFQRVGNWKGFLEVICQVLPYCFNHNVTTMQAT